MLHSIVSNVLTIGLPVTDSILHGSLYNFNCVVNVLCPVDIIYFLSGSDRTQSSTLFFVVVIRNTVVEQFFTKNRI